MAFYIVVMVCLTIGALTFRAESGDLGDKIFSTSMALVLSGLFGAMVAFLILPAIGVEYRTEWAKPLVKMKDAGYVKLVPSNGGPAFIFRPEGGYTQMVEENDEDEDAPEVHYYQTYKQPRVEKRCGYIEDWVFPWDAGTYGMFHGCDINIYVPAHRGVLLR